MSHRKPYQLAIIFSIALGVLFLFARRGGAQTDGDIILHDAWQNTENAGQYSFESRVTQTTLPAARITAVGQTAREESLFVEGMSDRSAGILNLTIWDDPTTARQSDRAIEVKVEGSRAFGRTTQSAEWQEMDDFSGQFAPSGDAAAFLSAAQNVVLLGSATSDVPSRDGGLQSVSYDRYRFTLNGDEYAEYMRQQFQDQLRDSGELPRGISLGASNVFKRMVAHGEAWVSRDGLPVRMEVSMEYPVQRNGERVIVDVVTTFTEFEGKGKSSFLPALCFGNCNSPNGGQWDFGGLFQQLERSDILENLLVVTVGLFVAVGLLAYRPKRTHKAVATALSFQMAFAPLGSIVDLGQIGRFNDRFSHLSTAEEEPSASDALQNLANTPYETIFDSTTSPLDVGRQQIETEQTIEKILPPDDSRSVPTVEGADIDGDGLEDDLEPAWYTSAIIADSDGDGMSDGAEAAICPERSGWFVGDKNQGDPACPDPFYADTDLDGLNDAEEVLYLGTLAQVKDTDGDGITDAAEVKGFLMPLNSADPNERRYSNPLSPDSDGDGLLDGIECPTMRRTQLTDDYRGSTSGNSPWTTTIRCDDTDGDGEPDIFDFDSDNDGVSDNMDAAPLQKFGTAFNRTTSMTLQLEDVAANEPIMVDFQIRPTIPEHLSYALNVLDWPSGDSEGQIQRHNSTTFGSVNGSTPDSIDIFNNIDSRYYGDMRLTPMLEVTLPGDTLDLPRVSADLEIPLTQAGRILSAFDLTANGESVTITVKSLAYNIPGTLTIGSGSCANNSTVWTQPFATVGGAYSNNTRLGTYANGGHVISFTSGSGTHCEPIPSLVKGTRTLSIYMQEPAKPFGTLQQLQNGNNALFYFEVVDPSQSYDAQVSTGNCSALGTTVVTLNGFATEQFINLSGVNDITDIADGEHAIRISQDDETLLCAPLGNIVNGSLGTMIDADKMDDFQITVSENRDGTLSALVPLSLATDPLTGRTEAFNGRMFYERSTTATLNNTVNLVWLVTVLTDYCPDDDCNHPFAVENRAQIVHTYKDESWFVTGLNVTEELGLSGAVVFEDAAAESDTLDEREGNLVEWDDNLWHLANGLQRIFIEGVDCDSADGTTCSATPNGVRDLRIGDIDARWGSGTNTSAEKRWDIPLDALKVQNFNYQHPGEMEGLLNVTIPSLLDNNFGDGTFPFTSTLGSPTTQVFPTLLIATEQSYRGIGIEATANASTSGNTLTIDFDPGAATDKIEPVTATALSWKPFRYTDGNWEAMPIEQYWDRLELMLPTSSEYLPDGDLEKEFEAAADIRFTQVAYLTIFAGIGNVVEVENNGARQNMWTITEGAAVTDKDIQTVASVINATGKAKGALTKAFLEPMYEVLDFEYSVYKRAQQTGRQRMVAKLEFTYKGAVGRAIKHAGLKITGWERLTNNAKNVTLTGKARAAGGVLTSTAAQLLVGTSKSIASMSNDKDNSTQQTVIRTLEGIGIAQSLGDNLKKVDKFFKFKAKLGSNTKSFSALTDSLKAGKVAKVVAIVGLVIEGALAVGIFIYQMSAAGVGFFTLQFNAALSGIVANLIVSVLLAALASTGVGAIIVGIIGLIDGLISLICGVAAPDKEERSVAVQWVCKGITGIMAEAVAYFIYDATDIIDLDNPQRMSLTTLDPRLFNEAEGFIPGASMQVDVAVRNKIQTQSFDSPLSLLYGWQFNEANTRSATFVYQMVGSAETDEDKQIHNGVKLDSNPNGWNDLGNDTYDQTFNVVPLPGLVTLPNAGINVQLPAFLAEGYASPTQECITWPNPLLVPPVIPECHLSSRNESNYIDLGLKFDVFPASLNDFYDLTPTGGGSYALAWGWGTADKVRFPSLVDADGDGLYAGIDPNDSLFDTDGDGVTDLQELRIGTNPENSNSDGDALTDLEEVRFGSDPLRADSDGDGLNDDLEQTGWSIGYNYINGQTSLSWAYSDPLTADADNDNVLDQRERALGLSPRAASDPSVMRYETDLRETDAAQLLVRFDETAAATTFVDSSSPASLSNGQCSNAQCPISGVQGLAVNAAYFDGNDVVSLGYIPKINQLTNNFTVAAWVNPDNISGRKRFVTISRTNGADGFGFGMSNGNLLFTAYGVVDFNGTAASAIPLGEWSHVAAVVESIGGQTRVSFYVDSQLTEQVTHNISGMSPSSNDDVLIGSSTNINATTLNEPFVGFIDEVVVYGTPLDENGIFYALYNAYNLDDDIVTGEAPLTFTTEIESKLLARNIEGLLQTETPAFLSGGLAPRNFNLAPREVRQAETQTFTFDSVPASGQYEITQTASAVIDVPAPDVIEQTDNLVYQKESADDYDGVSDYYSVLSQNRYDLDSTDFTLSLWVQQLPFGTDRRGVFGYRSGKSNGYPSVLLIGTKLIFGYGTGSSWIEREMASALPFDGKWHHVAISFDRVNGANNSVADVYVDQTYKGSLNFGSSRPDSAYQRFDIGRSSQTARFKFTQFKLECEADGPGDGEYNINYWSSGDYTDREYWHDSGSDGKNFTSIASVGWKEFEGTAYVSVCENDIDGSDRTTCDGDDERMKRSVSANTITFKTNEASYIQSTDVEFSTTPNDPTCGFWDGYDDIAQLRWEFENDSLPYDGAIKDVRLYTRAFNATQVTDLYASNVEISRFKMDERPGATLFNDALNLTVGSCSGTSCPTTGLPGRETVAVHFDGVNDYIEANDVSPYVTAAANHPDIQENGLTVAGWFKPDMDFPNFDAEPYLMGFHDSNGNNRFMIGLIAEGADRFKVRVYDGLTNGSTITPNSFARGEWHHVYFSVNYLITVEGNASISVNGTRENLFTMNTKPTSPGRFSIGQDWDGNTASDFYKGFADEIVVKRDSDQGFGAVGESYRVPSKVFHANDLSEISFPSSADPTIGAGQIYGAYDFDGSDDVRAGFPSNSFTIMSWVYPRNTTGNGSPTYRPISGSFFNPTIWLGLVDGKPAFYDSASNVIVDERALPEEQWSHVAFRRVDGVNQIFVNGALVESGTSTGDFSGALYIGGAYFPGTSTTHNFDGLLDEVAFYYGYADIAEEEIANIYNFQVTWVDEERRTKFTVDTEHPTVELTQAGQWLPLEEQVILLDSADEHSYVASTLMIYADSLRNSEGFNFASPCEDAVSGQAFCGLFKPQSEGEYQFEVYAIDAAGNLDETVDRQYLYVDGSAPTVTVDALPATPFAATSTTDPTRWTVALSGGVSDPNLADGSAPSNLESVTVTLYNANGVSIGSPPEQPVLVTAGGWSHQYVIRAENPTGLYTGEVVAIDKVGNKTVFPIAEFTIDNTDPSSVVTEINAPKATVGNGRSSVEVTQYLNASSSLEGTVTEKPVSAETQQTVAGIQAVEVAFEPINGSPFAASALPSGLELFLPFDENNVSETGSNDSYRDVVNGSVASCSGASCPTPGIDGRNGRGIHFDGVDDQLSLGVLAGVGDATNNFEVGAWIKLDDVGGSKPIIATDLSQSSANGWAFTVRADGGLRFDTFGVKKYDSTNITLKPNVWYHVVARINASNDVGFLVNDEYIETVSNSVPGNANGDDALLIGTSIAGRFAGVIDGLYFKSITNIYEPEAQSLLGDAPTLHLTFDDAPTDEVGGMDVDVTVSGGESDNSYTGIIGANSLLFGNAFGTDRASLIEVSAEKGVLVNPFDQWTLSFWMLEMGEGEIVFKESEVDYTPFTLAYSGSADSFTYSDANAFSYTIPITDSSGLHHYAFVWDYSNMTVYVDGMAVQTTYSDLAVSSPADYMSIGGDATPFALDDLQIHQRLLSADEVAAMAQANWQQAALPSRAVGAESADWTAQIPAGLEGFYTVRSRGTDSVGNVDEEPPAIWSGVVDTLAPRIIYFEVQDLGGGETQYDFSLTDFNLAVDDIAWPEQCALYPTETTFDATWYLAGEAQLGSDIERTTKLDVSCLVNAPLPPNSSFIFCDGMSNCTAIDVNGNVVPTAITLQNGAITATTNVLFVVLLLTLLGAVTLFIRRRRL